MIQARDSNLGIIARMDLGSGLQAQTLAYCKMLKPEKVLLIDSTPFNKAPQHPELYSSFNTDKVLGFPEIGHYNAWMQGLTHILSAETFYNDYFVNHAMRLGIKTFLVPNAEFYSHHVTPPTKFLMPSYWYLEDYQERYPDRVEYLPPCIFPNDFKKARETNFNRTGKPRFLVLVGKYADKDRNGTKSVMESLRYTESDFEIVIRSQYPLDFFTDDHRVKVEIGNIPEQQIIYRDFDALLYPRRYGGNSMPMIEALMSGLPVIMTDINPNNKVLPKDWLVSAQVHDKLQTRIMLDVYNADAQELARKIDWLCNPTSRWSKFDTVSTLAKEKAMAFEMGMNYAADNLRDKYMEVLA